MEDQWVGSGRGRTEETSGKGNGGPPRFKETKGGGIGGPGTRN